MTSNHKSRPTKLARLGDWGREDIRTRVPVNYGHSASFLFFHFSDLFFFINHLEHTLLEKMMQLKYHVIIIIAMVVVNVSATRYDRSTPQSEPP